VATWSGNPDPPATRNHPDVRPRLPPTGDQPNGGGGIGPSEDPGSPNPPRSKDLGPSPQPPSHPHPCSKLPRSSVTDGHRQPAKQTRGSLGSRTAGYQVPSSPVPCDLLRCLVSFGSGKGTQWWALSLGGSTLALVCMSICIFVHVHVPGCLHIYAGVRCDRGTETDRDLR